jgi:hypothetical protein
LSCKAVHNWVEKRGKRFGDEEVETGAEVAETTIKNFCVAGFDALVKRWGKCIIVGGREINVFSEGGISHVLRFISICDLFTDSLSLSYDSTPFQFSYACGSAPTVTSCNSGGTAGSGVLCWSGIGTQLSLE